MPAADTQTVERRGKVAKAIIFPAKRIVLAMVGGLGILSRERRHALGDETGLMFHSGGFKPDRGGLLFMRSSDKNGRRFSPVLLVGEDILKVNHPFCALPARKTYASRTTCDTCSQRARIRVVGRLRLHAHRLATFRLVSRRRAISSFKRKTESPPCRTELHGRKGPTLMVHWG